MNERFIYNPALKFYTLTFAMNHFQWTESKLQQLGLICLLVAVLVALPSRQSYADNMPLSFDTSQGYVSLSQHIDYVAESNSSLSIQEVMHLDSSAWTRSTQEIINFGYSKHVYWFRFSLKNTSLSPLERLLVIDTPFLEKIQVFQTQGDNIISDTSIGFSLPFSSHIVSHRNPIFPLTFQPQDSNTLYIRVVSRLPIQFPIGLWAERDFWEQDTKMLMFLCMVFGIMLIMIGYNLFVAIVTKEKIYFSYIICISNILMFSLIQKGLAAQYFWPDTPEFNYHSVVVFIATSVFSCSLLSILFLRLHETLPFAYRALAIIMGLSVILALSNFVIESNLTAILVTFLPTIMAVTILTACLLNWSKGDIDTRIFTVAWTSLLTGAVLLSLNKLGLISVNLITECSLQAGSAIEAVLISTALAIRITRLKRNAYSSQKRELIARNREMEALQESMKAKDANRAKANFLAVMSHEIRTPMNGVLGLTQLLKETTLDKKQTKLVSTIQQSGNTLLRLLNEILDFTKLERRNIVLETKAFSPSDIIRESVDILQFGKTNDDVELTYHIDDNIKGFIQGDPIRLQQILFNLVGNALKFTDSGQVGINVKKSVETDDMEVYEFHIIDTGMGMAEDQVHDIFKPFQQADFSTSRNYGGCGLGLAITKELVEIMGGKIGVVSELNVGSTFWFTLQFQKLDRSSLMTVNALPSQRKSVASSIKVLIAEDNEINVDVTTGFLDKLTVQHHVVENGHDAFETFKNHHKEFDIIFMDCEMPVLDGYDATKKIRRYEKENGLTRKPVVALTAHAVSEYLEQCKTSGMDDILIKPISPAMISNVLIKFLG